ncbi:MAG: LPS assembly protein LptD, partial [Desulfobacterales bacterium]|nr:LPS assembly protein LptD [Desulfobacterales bacterium]
LTSKQLMPANNDSGKSMGQPPSALYRYKQFCRIKLAQSYDVNEAREPSGEPFSPISGEIELKPSDMVSLQADAQWSVYENDFVSNNVTLKLTNKRKDELSVEYRHQNSEDEDDADDDEDEKPHSLYMNGLINLGDRLALFSEYEHNFEDGDDLTVAAGFRYRSGCWSFECKYSDESGDRKYAFMVTLNGLGNIGTSL